MVFCKICYTPMIGVLSFSKDKNKKVCRCPKCYDETKHEKIRNCDLKFGEVLKQTIRK